MVCMAAPIRARERDDVLSTDLQRMFEYTGRVAFGSLVKMESGRSGLVPLSTAENKEVHVRATQLRSLQCHPS